MKSRGEKFEKLWKFFPRRSSRCAAFQHFIDSKNIINDEIVDCFYMPLIALLLLLDESNIFISHFRACDSHY